MRVKQRDSDYKLAQTLADSMEPSTAQEQANSATRPRIHYTIILEIHICLGDARNLRRAEDCIYIVFTMQTRSNLELRMQHNWRTEPPSFTAPFLQDNLAD